MDFKNILLDLGYSNIKDNGRELRMRPLYRDSNNDTVLSVRKDRLEKYFYGMYKQIIDFCGFSRSISCGSML